LVKKHFWLKKILVIKDLLSKKFLVKKTFRSKKYFGQKYFLENFVWKKNSATKIWGKKKIVS